MTPAEEAVLADIRGYAAANRIQLTAHARQRMVERRTRYQELRSILMNAPSCSALVAERWRVHGVDCDGDGLDIIVVIQDGLIIITLFG
jgi:hypothetical protein